MSSVNVIFLDVHEVLAGWVQATCELLELNIASVEQRWDYAERRLGSRPWDFCTMFQSRDDVWRKLDAAGPAFWADVPLLPHAHQLYQACSEVAPTYLLTSPSKHPSCADGVTQWIQQHFGSDFRDYFIGARKHAIARPGALLIDDSPRHCKAWRNPLMGHGGPALLFPSITNELHSLRPDPLPTILKQLTRLQ